MHNLEMGDYVWTGNSKVWIQGYGTVDVSAELP
jgi:hypothetical protein